MYTRRHVGEKSNGVFTPEQDNDNINVDPVHFYDTFHTRSDMSGVKGIMHRFNICLVVVLLWCENTITVTSEQPFFPK